MRVVITVIAVLVVLAALLVILVYTGAYDVAADSAHSRLTRWALSTTMEKSVERQAAGIAAPDLSDPARVRAGAAHYKENCEVCHSGPGAEESEIHKGLNPRAPELVRTADDWSAPELFWIAKHGIKMSGMPAFGRTHSDEELWNAVAFVQELPKMSPARYAELTANAEEHHHHEADAGAEQGGEEHEEGGHEHGGDEAGGH